MGQVRIEIGGRTYPLSCRDGDEAHLSALAAGIAAKAVGLIQSLGPMSESRLLLMTALMVADELHELHNGKMPTVPPMSAAHAAAEDQIIALVGRAERLSLRAGHG